MENINSEDGLDRAVTTAKLRSPSQVSDTNTMDSFQDGGQQNMNPEQNDYPPSLDSSHVNSDSNNYPPTSQDGGVSSDNYGRMNENIHPPQMPGFGMYGRGSYGMGEQHGGLPMPGSSEFSNQTSQYHGQYLPPHSRTGFSGGPKPGMNPMRPGMGAPGMGMMPPSYNPAQTRLMSGQSISQQSGPTPTLNQLLQSPNSAQRYPNSFSDYGGSQKVPTDMSGYPMQQAWGPHQRAGGMNAFPQAQGANISGCQAFRNQQGGGNMSEMPQQRRSSGIPPNFPQQPSQYNNQQFSPNSQRYMMSAGQVRPGQMNQPFGQQQMPGQFGPNQMVLNQVMSGSQVVHQQPTPQQQPQPPGPSPPGHSPPGHSPHGHSPQAPLPNPPPPPPTSASQQPTQPPQSQPSPQPPPPHTSQPSPMQNQSPQHNQQNSPQNANRSHGKKSSDDNEGMEQNNTFDEINSENTRGSQGTPTPSGGLHPGVSNLRVTPSPAGSTGSRSNTPASITGNRASSPMPPRPPSSHLDGQMSQSQMSNQGFGQHIMPPPVGPNQMYNSGNKPMAGMNAVAVSAAQMGGHFSQYNSQFPGNTATMVTQAITAPVTSVVESMSNDSQQDLLSTYSISPMVNSTSTGAPMSSDEPPEKKKKDCVSHPPTPTNLSQSPSGTSVSSYPEEIENLNSPTSWSVGTPKPSQSADLHKLYSMGDEPDRKMFLDRLLYFLEEKGSPITSMPQISKQPLDLYKLYHSVKEKGGMVEVNKAKKWKEICAVVNIGSSASAAFTLKKNYVKYLFALECKYDKGGIDPGPILAQMEAAMQQKRESKQRRAPSPAGSQGSSQDAFRPPSTPNSNSQGMDPFSPNMQPYMGGPNSEPNMGPMGSGMMPHGSMMNSMNPSNNMMGQNSVGGPNSGMLPPHHMSSGPNSMHGNMMPGNMPPSNNMMGNSYAPNSMMPNNMGPNNSMMPNNMGSSSNNMLGNNMGPSNNNLASNMTQPAPPPPQNESDSVSVQDPFADEPCSSGPSYPRQSMNSQMPTYSGMQPQTTMSGAYGFNRQNAQHGMSPYSNMSQQSMNNYSENRIGQNEQYNDAYRRTMSMDNFNSNNRNTENFGPGNNQFGPRNSQGSGAQFPFGQQFDRERFDQPNPVNSNQQFRPPSQPGMVTPQQHPEQMYPSRYGSNQQMNPVRAHTPQHDQYPPQSGYPNQSNTFGSPRGVVPQEQYQNYPSQQSGFGGHRPPAPRDVPAGNMYGTPNKRFPPDVERRENFNMSGYNNQPSSFPEKPGGASMMYPQHREGMISPQDNPMHDSRRDPSQWSAMQQRFGSQHSGTSYPGSNMNAMPPGSGMLPPMVPPSPSSTGRTMNPRLSPQREKPYMSPPRVQKPGGMVPNAQLPPKKEISFPPDSVEAVQPLLAKRKRLAKQDIGQTEPWKLMMALKSGMLAESTWALDTLSILLFDDSTVTYFTLSHLPGLLEVLLEHFRRCLIDMFGLFNELEVGYDAVLIKQKEKDSLKSFKAMDVEDYKNLESDTVWKEMRIGENYTYITRQGKVVKVNENDRETALLEGKQWDIYSGFTSKAKHWQLGGGDMSAHVQTHFESLNNHKIFKKLFYYRGIKKDCQDEIVNNMMPLKLSCRSPAPAEQASDRENTSFKTTPPPPSTDHKSVNGVVDNENLHNCINKIHIKKEPIEDEEKENAAKTRVGTQPAEGVDVATPAVVASDCVKEEPQQEQQQNCNNNNNQRAEENQSNSSESHNAKNAVNNEKHCEKDGIVKMDFETQNKENEKPAENNIVKSEDQIGNPVKRETRLTAPLENGVSVELMLIKAQMCDDQEEEAFERDSPAVCLMSEAQDEIGRRCVCISNIFRSLSCIQGNDSEMSRHPGLLYILGKLLLLHHQHPPRVKVRRKLDKEEPELEDISVTEHEWWWDNLHALRENTLVIFANICGQLDLSIYPEEICLPILNGLLHWAVCPSACAQDPLPSMSPSSVLSPQRLVLEALCKLCIHEANVDLLLATPPFNRIVQLVNNLTKMLANKKEQVTQEFAIVLLSELVQGDSSAARAIAMQHPSVSLLIDFLETAENNAVQVVSTHGINVLRDSPEMMGTSLDMLRRTANILVHLARVPENRPYFVHQQSRLLNLVMSQILDQHVAQTLADVLYECSHS